MSAAQAKFTEGSLIRHILVMSATSSVGLMAIFLVDVVNILYVSWLGDPVATAAVGYAGAVLFFSTATAIGLSIAVSALVARALGARDAERARQAATNGLLVGAVFGVVLNLGALMFLGPIVAALGAQGETAAATVGFLQVSLTAQPLLLIGIMGTAILRGHGDARRAMMPTVWGALALALVDPVFIFWLDGGLMGAAWAGVVSRTVIAATALWPILRHHGGFDRPAWAGLKADLLPFFAIAGPAMLTQLATPMGQAIVTRLVADYGEAAVAGMAIAGRLTPVAFGIIFALSGAIGPIIGQNFGAGRIDRVRTTFWQATGVATAIVVAMALVLFLLRGAIADLFQAEGLTRDLLYLFCGPLALLFVFNGWIFVSNAACNNLGAPMQSTAVNWGRHTLGTLPFALVLGGWWGGRGRVDRAGGRGCSVWPACALAGAAGDRPAARAPRSGRSGGDRPGVRHPRRGFHRQIGHRPRRHMSPDPAPTNLLRGRGRGIAMGSTVDEGPVTVKAGGVAIKLHMAVYLPSCQPRGRRASLRAQDRENPVWVQALTGAEGATAPVNSQAKGPFLHRTLESGARARRRDNDLRRPSLAERQMGKDRGGIERGIYRVNDVGGLSGSKTGGRMGDLLRLGLNDLHEELGGKMVPFAGHSMPVQYPMGVMKEHLHTRAAAGLFDVSHMGQVLLRPKADMAALVTRFEAMMPVDVAGLAGGRQRYGLFTNDAGGVLDDLMFANRGDHLFVVVNAACKGADIALMRARLGAVAEVVEMTDRALLALQGPLAETALARLVPDVAAMRFMDVAVLDSAFGALWVSRSGYTGEDGFEVSVAAEQSESFTRALLAMEEVAPIGLGARDSLRLEAGLPLYGHDIDDLTSPVIAGLSWAIQKSRRKGGAREGGFPGADRILEELERGPLAVRTGLRPEGRAPMREGTLLFDAPEAGQEIGRVTSGGFGPSVEAPIAMGYVPAGTTGTVWGEVRGKRLPAKICPLPFHPTNYKR